MQLWFCLVVTNHLRSIKNKKITGKGIRPELQLKIWIKPATDNHWNDALDAGQAPHGSMCTIICNEPWKLLCNKLRQPSCWGARWSFTSSDSGTQGQRDCSIKSISMKAFFFHPLRRYMLFNFHLVKLQGTGFGLPFYVADSMLTKQRSGAGWGDLFKLSPQRCFSYGRPPQSRGIWNPSLEEEAIGANYSWKKGGEREEGNFKTWERRGG